jgi:hypothetical protein
MTVRLEQIEDVIDILRGRAIGRRVLARTYDTERDCDMRRYLYGVANGLDEAANLLQRAVSDKCQESFETDCKRHWRETDGKEAPTCSKPMRSAPI